jgi:hypothetical protein
MGSRVTRSIFEAVGALVRAWTWCYTLPLDPLDRHRRRTEIASDLWEFRADRLDRGRWLDAAAHVLARALLGVPDDVRWVCEQASGVVARPAIVRAVVVVFAATTVVLSARAPAIDPARALKVDVQAAGWIADPARVDESQSAVAPAIAFTLTNVASESTGALQVNAVFHRAGDDPHISMLGTAFASIVGWRGLPPGATSPRVFLHGDALYVLDAASARHIAVPLTRVDEAAARLYIQHEGRWTPVGDFRIPIRRLPR